MKLMNEYFNQKKVDLFFATTANLTTNMAYKIYRGQCISFNEYNEDLLFIFKLNKIFDILIKENKLKFIFYLLKPIISICNYLINIYYFIVTRNIENNYSIYNSFNKDFDLLWKNLKKNNKTFNFIRNKNWLNYHFEYYKKSNKIFIIVDKSNNKIINSYSILIEKHNVKLNLKKLCLVDIISLNNNDKDYNNLIKFCINLTKLKGYDYLEIVGFNTNKRKTIKKFFPFIRKFKYSRYCYFTTNKFLKNKLANPQHLDFSMIDGDAII